MRYVRDNPEQLDDPSWQVGMPQSIIDDIKQSLKKPGQLGYYQITPLRRPTLARKIAQLSESGVVLLIGTDSGIPMNFHSQTTWRELDAWVNTFNIDPMTTIRAATYWPSVAMKVSDRSAPSAKANTPTLSRCEVTSSATSTCFRTSTS